MSIIAFVKYRFFRFAFLSSSDAVVSPRLSSFLPRRAFKITMILPFPKFAAF
jgi:hypothetical protein